MLSIVFQVQSVLPQTFSTWAELDSGPLITAQLEELWEFQIFWRRLIERSLNYNKRAPC